MKATAARILIAPGPYKECLDSFCVAQAMERGVREIFPDAVIDLRPLCDGGSGIARVLTEVTGGELKKTLVLGPLYQPIETHFGILGDGRTAVIESASAAGLALVPKTERNPLNTTTYGVGQLICAAVNSGATRIIVGCGDSGTNDCGIGCAVACGVKIYAADTKLIERPVGRDLLRVASFDSSEAEARLARVQIIVACNLTSILCGREGTSRIYGPQKGATPEQAEELERGVQHFVDLFFARRGLDMSFVPGAGGAGGLAASLYGFFKAKLRYSIDVVDEYVQLDRFLQTASIVLTGEGQIDDRTATGKVGCGVALKAKQYGLPVVAIVGAISADHEDIFYNGIDAVECISEGPISLQSSIKDAEILIQRAASRVIRFVFKMPESTLPKN
jgi:glycerate kinase